MKEFGKEKNQMQSTSSKKLIENLKKAVTEMLILSCLNLQPMSIDEISRCLDEKSHSICKIVYPYAAIHRLLDTKYITETSNRQMKDDRHRQYYKITKKGIQYLAELRAAYETFTQEVNNIFKFVNI